MCVNTMPKRNKSAKIQEKQLLLSCECCCYSKIQCYLVFEYRAAVNTNDVTASESFFDMQTCNYFTVSQFYSFTTNNLSQKGLKVISKVLRVHNSIVRKIIPNQ